MNTLYSLVGTRDTCARTCCPGSTESRILLRRWRNAVARVHHENKSEDRRQQWNARIESVEIVLW